MFQNCFSFLVPGKLSNHIEITLFSFFTTTPPKTPPPHLLSTSTVTKNHHRSQKQSSTISDHTNNHHPSLSHVGNELPPTGIEKRALLY
ncbi:hypothetical protein QL285_025416 [Trifolium repens]|nr:hypothetical protein QL285_025416 [Trifolium repens]